VSKSFRIIIRILIVNLISIDDARAAFVDYGLTLGAFQNNGSVVSSGSGLFELGVFSGYDDTLGASYFTGKDYATLRNSWTAFAGSSSSMDLNGDFYVSAVDLLSTPVDTRLFAWGFSSTSPDASANWTIVSGTIGDTSAYGPVWLAVAPSDITVNAIELGTSNNTLYANSGPANSLQANEVAPSELSANVSVVTEPAPSEAPIITSLAFPIAVMGEPFSYQITASGQPISYEASNLPTGLTIDISTGLISGTPTALGVFVVTITALNGADSDERDLTLEIKNGTFNIQVADADVTVQRYGTGPKAVIFFGYAPFEMEENLKRAYGAQFADLVGTEYSMFLWTYPTEKPPYSEVAALVEAFDNRFDPNEAFIFDPLDFAGQATSVVEQILTATRLDREEATLVGNSFGAGVLLEDFDALTAENEKPRFVLISPSELFLPEQPPDQLPLPRTILIADTKHDGYLVSKEVRDYIAQRTSGPLPPDYNPVDEDFNPHFIIGEEPTSLAYVFGLIDLLDRPTTITSARTATGQVARDFRYAITENNTSRLRTTYSATGLPSGLSLNTTTGVITGRPTVAGTFRPQIQAINAAGTATATLTLNIAAAPRPALSVTPTTLKGFSAKRGKASKSRSFTVSGSNLTSQVTVRAPAGYQVSRSATKGYASSLKVAPAKTGSLARTTIHVRLAANKKAKVGNRNGKVTISSTGASARSVSLTGRITR
jgi:hypothetical protein